jgi:hypothetical protein
MTSRSATADEWSDRILWFMSSSSSVEKKGELEITAA